MAKVKRTAEEKIIIIDDKDLVEEDATQAGGIAGPVGVFGTPANEVDDAYKELLNLNDYE